MISSPHFKGANSKSLSNTADTVPSRFTSITLHQNASLFKLTFIWSWLFSDRLPLRGFNSNISWHIDLFLDRHIVRARELVLKARDSAASRVKHVDPSSTASLQSSECLSDGKVVGKAAAATVAANEAAATVVVATAD